MTEATGSSELVERLRGRARFCRDRREIKSPDVMEEAADRITDLEARLARAEEALRKCASVMGETLDKDFGFWSSAAQDDRSSRFYPAWKDASAALKEQDNG